MRTADCRDGGSGSSRRRAAPLPRLTVAAQLPSVVRLASRVPRDQFDVVGFSSCLSTAASRRLPPRVSRAGSSFGGQRVSFKEAPGENLSHELALGWQTLLCVDTARGRLSRAGSRRSSCPCRDEKADGEAPFLALRRWHPRTPHPGSTGRAHAHAALVVAKPLHTSQAIVTSTEYGAR